MEAVPGSREDDVSESGSRLTGRVWCMLLALVTIVDGSGHNM